MRLRSNAEEMIGELELKYNGALPVGHYAGNNRDSFGRGRGRRRQPLKEE